MAWQHTVFAVVPAELGKKGIEFFLNALGLVLSSAELCGVLFLALVERAVLDGFIFPALLLREDLGLEGFGEWRRSGRLRRKLGSVIRLWRLVISGEIGAAGTVIA
jgi:hypothetical protein